MIVKNFLLTVNLIYLKRISKIYSVNQKSEDYCFYMKNEKTIVISENEHIIKEAIA